MPTELNSVVIRARTILPVASSPIEDGALAIKDGIIAAIGTYRTIRSQAAAPLLDLGEVIVFPGLVNSHCHLEFSNLAPAAGPPGDFTSWARQMVQRSHMRSQESSSNAWCTGAEQLVRTGTTSVANFETAARDLPALRKSTPLRISSFIEITGRLSGRPPNELFAEASQKLLSLGEGLNGLAPHAAYSTRPALLREIASYSSRSRRLVSIHVAESEAEFDFFQGHRGPLFEWLYPHWANDEIGCGTPVQYLERHGLLGNALIAVHANFLGPDDPALLVRRGTPIVHCPRSHQFFAFKTFPFVQLARQGINVALGTDSLASIAPPTPYPTPPAKLSLLAEMQTLCERNPDVSPQLALETATLNGARALGVGESRGKLVPGAVADLAVIPVRSVNRSPEECVVNYQEDVAAVMIGGQWVWKRADFSGTISGANQ
jgi:cytosine/adenosine deaminase-related metal-dependent hydrolase